MRLLLFILFIILLSPLLILALIVYTIRLRFLSIPRGISGTANEPFGARVYYHLLGTRPDHAAYALSSRLPTYTLFVRLILIDAFTKAVKWSGYRHAAFTYPVERRTGLATFIGQRTEFLDRVMAEAIRVPENAVQQVVILGAGWDTRCYDLPTGLRLKCFEVDMPPTLAAKVSAIRSARIAHDHVTYVETDFNQEDWLDKLVDAGFDPSITSFVLWEGVCYYLDEAAARKTLQTVATLGTGTRIAFDFFSQELINGEPPFELLGKNMNRGARYYREKFNFGIKTADSPQQNVEELLHSCGLQLVEYESFSPEDSQSIGGLVLAEKV